MSDPVFAVKDANAVIAEALAFYKAQTGVTLAPADPRRLHLQTMVLLLSQQRDLIDFAGKQNLLRFVSDDWIDYLAALWGLTRLPATAAQYTERFNFATVAARTLDAGVRVSDGTNLFTVLEDTSATDDHIDALVECTIAGSAANGIEDGQIDTLVDPSLVPGCTGVSSIAAGAPGRDLEALEDFRERLRLAPESTSTAGPRLAYEALAKNAAATVADAVALGPDDGGDMVGYPPQPGEVFVFLIEGARDEDGVLISVEHAVSGGLITTVEDALSAEDVRPLTDFVTVKAAETHSFVADVTYYIAQSRSSSAAEIQVAVAAAMDAWLLWQQSKVARDVNPSELIARLVNAGAKRVVVADPAFSVLMADERAVLSDDIFDLNYGGVEAD